MKPIILNVDEKGRLHIPKKLREVLGISAKVKVTVRDGMLVVEPTSALLDTLANRVRFSFKSVEDSLPGLRRAAEKQLIKEISS